MSTTIPPTTSADELTSEQLELQRRAREFVEHVLMPLELEAEERGGALPEATVDEIKREAIAARLNGGRFAAEYGGQGWSMFEWFLVNEQFGRVTNGLHWHVPSAYNVLMQGTPEQIERYLLPALRGEGGDAYAVTEAEAGSDPGGIASTAVATDAGWRINGEKWFVTSGDVARVLIVMANVVDGADRLPTLFLIEPSAPGVEYVDNPRFTHNYPHGHPTIRFTDVEVGPDAAIGGIGEGEALQRAWFTEERLGIATHGLGAMWRLLDETTAWTQSRMQGGQRILDYQGISFPLADSATDATVGRLLAIHVARMVDAEADLKLIHAKASMAKLFVSEAAGRCADRAVQAFGGRGYLRTNVAERFNRELRVDRIWEGTSEVQRLIISRALERRGVEATIH
jgi:acyl-CoA dehydrogenase